MLFPFDQWDDTLTGELPEEWLTYLQENVLLYRLLPEAEQARLRELVAAFIPAKYWEGCGGMTITDEVCVTIAGQACLLLLGFDDYLFDRVKSILVYPGGFLAGTDEDQSERLVHLLGQAHPDGPVALSWWHVRGEGRCGWYQNLVIHEFAHQLTPRSWEGLPPVETFEEEERWRTVMRAEYRRLVEAARRDLPTLIDPYGATSPSEFFAVVTECFFLRPVALREEHPQLYQLFADWFHQDPAGWRTPDENDRAAAERAAQEYAEHIIAECTAAIRRRPDYTEAYLLRASYLSGLNRLDEALGDYTAVLQRHPNDAEAACERGLVLRELDRYDEAIADFTRAIRHVRRYGRAYCERGTTYRWQGNLDQALDDLTRAIRIDPEDGEAYYERGRARHARGEPRKAVADFTRALRHYPRWAEALAGRAAARLALGHHDRAIADSTEAIRLDPDDAEAYRVRAKAYAALGEMEKARADEAAATTIEGGAEPPSASHLPGRES
jgi:hypothetical protein